MYEEGDGKNMEFLPALFDAFVYNLKNAPPDILILTGDLTFNGELDSHRELAGRLKTMEDLGIKVYVIPGNHDIQNPFARRFSQNRAYSTPQVSPEDFARIYRGFGYAEAISRDAGSLSYVVQPFAGLRLFMLDSNIYQYNNALGMPVSEGEIKAASRAWLKTEAEAAKKAGCRLIAAMHHSLTEHNAVARQSWTVADSPAIAELFASLGINLVLTGHIHVQSIAQAPTPAGPVWDIATSAFSVFPHEYGLLEWLPESAGWKYSLLPVEVEGYAKSQEKGADSFDERLLTFSAYGEAFFRGSSERMIRRRLAELEEPLTEAESALLIDLVGTLNANFFAGRSGENPQELLNSPGFEILSRRLPGFLDHYIQSIRGGETSHQDREALIPDSGNPRD
jgi:3',5'-cyclic AMP phosphodiesterase CpdA